MIRSAALALGLALLLPAPAVMAETRYATNAGAACRAPMGFQDDAFYFSSFAAVSEWHDYAYLVCGLGALPVTADFGYVDVANPTGSEERATCVFASSRGGIRTPENSRSQSLTLGPHSNGRLVFDSMPPRDGGSAYSLWCQVPPGWKVGLIVVGTNA